ncbi:MAG: IS200/IS605 family transposase [Paludibacteraceae bacterium]|nr:IS200/IS605 family transposase [Paludibacteraceae bacterium]MCQ2224395.1 IS200/IS605 family transposase [Paludibacteraceae bacterium]
MAHLNLTYHIVWRTKCSQRTISETYERELYAYILGLCIEKKCHLYRINSMPDHVHICVEIHPTIAVSEFVRIVKQETSKWMKEKREKFPMFDGWGNGYAGFTYSVKERPAVIKYIKEQKIHHKEKSFRKEFEEWQREMGEDPTKDLFFKD